MDTRYNVYYAGQVLEGHDPATVRANLAKLFSADEQTLDKLFSGKVQLLKRECEEALARRYEEAMQRAGAQPIIRAMDVGEDTEPPAPPPAKPESAAGMSAAERIAALAAEPDDDRFRADRADRADAADTAAAAATGADEGGLGLEPPGTEVLREHERAAPVQADIDTSGLAVDAAAQRLSEERPPPPTPPDSSHLSLGEAGDTLPNLPGPDPIDPDTSYLDLDPPGTDFADCASAEAEAPELDLSGLDVAPEGSDVLEARYRKRPGGAAPDTDHLSIDS